MIKSFEATRFLLNIGNFSQRKVASILYFYSFFKLSTTQNAQKWAENVTLVGKTSCDRDANFWKADIYRFAWSEGGESDWFKVKRVHFIFTAQFNGIHPLLLSPSFFMRSISSTRTSLFLCKRQFALWWQSKAKAIFRRLQCKPQWDMVGYVGPPYPSTATTHHPYLITLHFQNLNQVLFAFVYLVFNGLGSNLGVNLIIIKVFPGTRISPRHKWPYLASTYHPPPVVVLGPYWIWNPPKPWSHKLKSHSWFRSENLIKMWQERGSNWQLSIVWVPEAGGHILDT